MIARYGRYTLPAVIAVVLWGCDALTSDLEGDPADVPIEEVITIQRKGTGALRADRNVVDTLFALLPRGANARAVTFRTTIGSFDFTAGAKEYKTSAQPEAGVSTDKLVARAILRADTIAGTTTVSASVGDFTTYTTIPFVRP